MSGGRARWSAGLAIIVASACAPHRPPAIDAGAIGPEGSVLTFDAAMLVHPDAGGHPVDAYVPNHDAYVGGHDGGHRCTGVAQSCSLVGSASCSTQLGCTRAGNCTGVSEGCYSFFDSFSCYSQDGCIWSSSTSTSYCTGSAYLCSSESGSSLCAGQQGCSYTYTCTGVVTQCSSFFDQFSCASQLGCLWQ